MPKIAALVALNSPISQYFMWRKLSLVFLFLSFSISLLAQKAQIKGSVTDTVEKRNLQYCSVLLIRNVDSLLIKSTRTTENGSFELTNLYKGRYTLLITYPKMADYFTELNLFDSSKIDLGKINMDLKSLVLNEVVVRAAKNAIGMRGDTLVFQADSFAVKPHANVEALLKRLPGIEVDKNGQIKAQGEVVKTVLVDGDEFFGDDPLLATKYLKANSVQEIQVYDKKSNQAELTGVEDGQKSKTINIKLKDDAKNGYLSTVDLKSNLANLHDYGGLIGAFKDKLKAGVFSSYSNLNTNSKIYETMGQLQNNDYDAIDGGDENSYSSEYNFDNGPYYGSGLPHNFRLGATLSNKWDNSKKSLKLNFQTFNNQSKDYNTSNSENLLPDGTRFISSQNSSRYSKNIGQILQSAFSIKIDSLSNLKFNFGLNKSKVNSNNQSFDKTENDLGIKISENLQNDAENAISETFDGNINYVKRYIKKGRTLLIDVQPQFKNGQSIGFSQNITNYYDSNGLNINTEDLELRKENTGKKNSIGTRINYTEPLSNKISLQTGYSFKAMNSVSNKETFDTTLAALQKVDSLSNNFEYNSLTNAGKLVVQFKAKKIIFASGLEATQSRFRLDDRDRLKTFDRSYINLAPRANLEYSPKATRRVSLNYNGTTSQPNIDQLQPIREINNPLYQVIGNPNLKPSFSNAFSIRFSDYNFISGRDLNVSARYWLANNEIVSVSNVDEFNKKTVSYVNMDGNYQFSASVRYSKRFKEINTGLDFNYSRGLRKQIINATLNETTSKNYSVTGNFSYYTEKFNLDFDPSITLSDGTSTIGDVYNGKNVSYEHELSGGVTLPYNIEFGVSSSFTYQKANSAFTTAFKTNIINSFLSTRLLPNEALQVKLSVSDILNQRLGYYRDVSGSSISQGTYTIIPRYLLLGVSYNLSGNFVKNDKK